MPTGYTAAVADGTVTDVKTFILRCARAMGACIMQRDDPMDDLPKLQPLESFDERKLNELRARLAYLQGLSDADAQRDAGLDFAAQQSSYDRYAEERRTTRDRYRAMIDQVRAWQPPTPDHVGLKEFMLQQLDESLAFDTHDPTPPRKTDGVTWRAEQIAETERLIGYYTGYATNNKGRAISRNQWIRALYTSLGMTAVERLAEPEPTHA